MSLRVYFQDLIIMVNIFVSSFVDPIPVAWNRDWMIQMESEP